MNKLKALMIGFLLLILLWILMLSVERGKIEHDVGSRTQQKLKDAGQDWASVKIEKHGRDISLIGIARDQKDIDTALSIASQVYGVRVVDNSGVTLRTFSPANLAITFSNDEILLAGAMQTQEISNKIATVVKTVTGKTVVNNITMDGDIAIPVWLDSVDVLTSTISVIKDGALAIEKDNLSLTGMVRTQEEKRQANAILGKISGISSIDLSDIQVIPLAPSTFSMKSVDGVSLLSGQLSSEADRDALITSARGAFNDVDSSNLFVDENTEVVSWAENVSKIMGGLKGIHEPGIVVEKDIIKISGTVRTNEAQDALNSILKELGDTEIDIADLQVIPLKPSFFSMKRVGEVTVLSGQLSSEAGRDELITSVGGVFGEVDSSNLLVDKNTEVVSWAENVSKIMGGLKGIHEPGIVVEKDIIKISGTAHTNEALNDLNAVLTELDDTETIVKSDIAVKLWQEPSLGLSYDQGLITLTGELPDQIMIDQAISAAGEITSQVAPDGLKINADASEPVWMSKVVSLISSIEGFRQANLTASNKGIALVGTASTDSDKAKILQSIQSAMGGENVEDIVALTINIEMTAEMICEQIMDELRAEGTIKFNTESAEISENGFELLDGFATAVNDCPNTMIEIDGHADSTGENDYNQNLSESRAKSAVTYLISAGIDQSKLSERGYSSNQPVADNSTSSGRALNRRIEINIITSRL